MNKRTIFGTIGILSLIVSAAMYIIGGNNPRLTELKQYWWAPLIVAVLCMVLAGPPKSKV